MYRIRGVIAAFAAVAGIVSPAVHATAAAPDLTGPNVIRYQDSNGTAAREVVTGRRTATGCAFSRPATLRPGQSESIVELAYDPDTCRSLVAVRSGAAVATPVTGSAGSATQSGTIAGAAAAPGSMGIESAFGRFRAYQWSWFDEPARWVRNCDVEDSCGPLPPVNTVKNTVEWTPDGSCAIAPGTSGWAESNVTWFTTTGWEMLRNDFTYPASPVPCNVDAYSQNVNHFQNQEFCAVVGGIFGGILGGILGYVAETDTYYEPNRVRGDENASAFFNVSWRKDGLCNQLLQFNDKYQSIQIG